MFIAVEKFIGWEIE